MEKHSQNSEFIRPLIMKWFKNILLLTALISKIKNNLISLICVLFIFGCSQDNAALNAVVVGTNIVCNDGHYILFVAKRDGNSLEDIKLTVTAPNGEATTLMAEKGAISKSEKPNCFRIKLYNGQENEKANKTWQLSVFDLQPINISQK